MTKSSRVQMIQNNIKIMKGGPKLKNLGKTVVVATIGDYLVNLDLWMIIPWVADRLTTNEPIEFFQLFGFLK